MRRAEPTSGGYGRRARHRARSPIGARVASAFVLVLLVFGCFGLWLGAPAAGMWLAAKLTDSFAWHMPVALVLVVTGMLATAIGLAWLNDLYLRITGGPVDASGKLGIRRGGPLEPMLVGSLAIAFVALLLWVFVLGDGGVTPSV